MKPALALVVIWVCLLSGVEMATGAPATNGAKVFIIPIREDIAPPLLYLMRRGVKQAIEEGAELLIIDMETNGGRLDTTEELIGILNEFKGDTVTYVNRKAFSAGAFIAIGTKRIFMAPQSVIGAAAPLLMVPGGGPTEMPATLEAKMTSGVRAVVRASAEKNGYNVEVVEAMIDKTKELVIDGETLNEKGQILTLTNKQAEKEYATPPRPLLSSGTFETLDQLVAHLGYEKAGRQYVTPTGVEKLGSWINTISPLLLIIGMVGIYLEFKTPGFGLPGIVGMAAFGIYFFGGYVAGLSGMEWMAVFVIGVLLFALELFVFPGTMFLGLSGAGLMLISVIMAMVDIYPAGPGLPGKMRIRIPMDEILTELGITFAGTALAVWLLSLVLPKSTVYSRLVSQSASGERGITTQETLQQKQVGEIGTTISVLRPGGKAQFGTQVIDVISQGELIEKNQRVRVIGHSGHEAIVEIA